GVLIVNAARGGLIDEDALADALRSGHVGGAGIDVFATEPTTVSPLFDLPNAVVTPHLGASTAEAQDRAGTDVARSVLLALRGGYPDGSILTVSGTLAGLAGVEKIVEVNGRHFDLRAEGYAVLLEYPERPGVMGTVGTLLGEAGVNIDAAQISQTTERTDAV